MAETKRRNVGRTVFGWLIVIGLLAAAACYYFFFQEDVIEVTAATLTRGHVEQTITAISSGTVKPRLESMVAAATVGKVANIPVKEGQHVEAGGVLVELEHAELDAQVALSEANLRVGKSRLEQARIAAGIYEEIARTRVSQAEAQLNVAKLDFDRIQALSKQKAVSQSDFDKVALAYRVALEASAAAKASQEENKVRQEEIRSAEAAVTQLEAGLRLATEMRDKAFVRAPFEGVVARKYVDVGEVVGSGLGSSLGGGGLSGAGVSTGTGGATTAASTAGGMSMASATALVHLVQNSDLYVKAPFDEANVGQIALGQKARIGLDAFRGTDFPGRVTFISPIVTKNLDLSRTLDIDVEIEEGEEKFVVGMSADVIIVADEKENVLFVPGEALIREEEVYVIENGRAVRRKVNVGLGNWQAKEVLDGVREGETVITSVSVKGLANGVRVRVVDALDEI